MNYGLFYKVVSFNNYSMQTVHNAIANTKHKIAKRFTNLKLFLIKTPSINSVIMDKDKNNSGNI